jgi:hypothetical protein
LKVYQMIPKLCLRSSNQIHSKLYDKPHRLKVQEDQHNKQSGQTFLLPTLSLLPLNMETHDLV